MNANMRELWKKDNPVLELENKIISAMLQWAELQHEADELWKTRSETTDNGWHSINRAADGQLDLAKAKAKQLAWLRNGEEK